MSFEEKIYLVINNAFGNLFSGGIYSNNLPMNFDYKKPTCVIQYKLDRRIDTIEGFTGMEEYSLQIVLLSKSNELNGNNANTIKEYFDDFEDENIVDIQLQSDLNEVEFDVGYYIKSLSYKILYE